MCLLTSPYTSRSVTVVDTGSTYDGIGVEVTSASVENGQLRLDILWDNQTDYTVNYGVDFQVYKYENDEWQLHNEYGPMYINDLLYRVPPHNAENSRQGFTYNNFSGLPDPGKYRLTTDFDLSSREDNSGRGADEYIMWVDFEIK